MRTIGVVLVFLLSIVSLVLAAPLCGLSEALLSESDTLPPFQEAPAFAIAVLGPIVNTLEGCSGPKSTSSPALADDSLGYTLPNLAPSVYVSNKSIFILNHAFRC